MSMRILNAIPRPVLVTLFLLGSAAAMAEGATRQAGQARSIAVLESLPEPPATLPPPGSRQWYRSGGEI